MKILVTGINGFVGQHLRRELESRGHDVWGIDTNAVGSRIINADILKQENLDAVIKDISPESVIHLAAISSVDYKEPSAVYNVNFGGTLNLLSSCKDLKSLPDFLFISSSQVYGNVPADRLPVDESFPVEPVNHYGASKSAAEAAVRVFGAEYGIPYVIARPFNHTGPGQSDRFVVSKIVKAFKRCDEYIELGNIDTVRDFVDVRDVVKAYAMSIENFKGGAIYNISSGCGISVSDIFEKIKTITGRDMKIIKKEFLVRKNEIKSITGNATKIENEIGWKPAISIERTFKDMLEM